MPTMRVPFIPNVKFRCRLGDHDIDGYVVNPGGWWPEEKPRIGKTQNLWLIQVAISNALNPFVAVEASDESSAIDELADSDQFGHLINMDEKDAAEREADEIEVCRCGNDGHPVDLDNVHIQKAPLGVTYFLEWTPQDHELSSAVDDGIKELRDERLEEIRAERERNQPVEE